MLKRAIIDVVVPVHDAHNELVACVESVQRNSSDYRLILIDDGSTDERIGALFRRLSAAKAPHVVLLRNERNEGFVATVNRGMAFGRNDVVLLNSDTVVTRGWLDKLRRCAASDPAIGTVTPFSNNAEICSFPRFCEDNPALEDPELVNRAMELAAVPVYPAIPTAVGFCMYIRRRLIRELGAFDPVFGKGYGEENDFSMRASAAGYRNVLCDDTFVVHLGSRSFGGHRLAMIEQNLVKVLAKHPDYMTQVREFIAKDPIKPIRSMIQSQVAVLSRRDTPGVIHVLHPRGGGTEKYVQELISASRDEYRHYFLRILPDRWRVVDVNAATEASYECPRQEESGSGDWLRSLCAWLRIDLAHVHSLVGSGDDLLRMLEAAAIPYCYSVWDMYLPCPTIYLIDGEGTYCDATTDAATCRKCLSKFNGLEHTDIERWRVRYAAFLAGASKVFAPSQWARDTLLKYYPGIAVEVAPPRTVLPDDGRTRAAPDVFALPNDECRHIGVLGAIGPEKGARILETLVERIRERRLPLRMVVVGYTDRESRHQSSDAVLTIHGAYSSDEIAGLCDHYRVALLLFPTIWPETFSYTLSEGWLAGRPALVPPRGALQERVLATGAGWTISGWPSLDLMLDQLMVLTAPENAAELQRRSRLAMAVFPDGDRAAPPLNDLYAGVPAAAAANAGQPVSRDRIYRAACCALGMEPEVRSSEATVTESVPRRSKVARFFRLFRS
jgi:GT2 family glycosyltransferase